MPAVSLRPDQAAARAWPPGARFVLATASLTTTLAAAWLLWTSVAVLPARDPGHIAMWRAVAAGMIAFAALSAATLRPGARAIAERVVLAGLGTIAAGAGLGAAVREEELARAGGHFEGYLLLLAVLIAAHGIAALAVALPERGRDARA